MLQAKDMFNIPKESIGRTASELTVYSLPFGLLMTGLISYAFEILGRKWTLFLSFATTALIFFGLPHTAPHYALLVVARCAIGVTMAGPVSHPLVADYVHTKSRGRAIALSGVGLVMGEVAAMGGLFNLTKSMNFYDAFAVAALVIGGFAIFCLVAIADPDLKNLRRGIDGKLQGEQSAGPPEQSAAAFEGLPLHLKIAKLTGVFLHEVRAKPVLSLSVAGATITRLLSVLFSTYLILWIQHFADDPGDGTEPVLADRNAGKTIYMNMMVISVVLSALVLPLVGRLCDSFPASQTVPFAFLLRCSSTILFCGLTAPDSRAAYAVCAMMIVGTIVENVSVDTVFYKNLAKETRGVLCGAYSSAG